MRQFLLCMSVFLIVALLQTPTQSAAAEELCVDYFGVGLVAGEECTPFRGPSRKIRPSELTDALTQDLVKLNIVSDDTPEEDFDLAPLSNNTSLRILKLYREGEIDLTPLHSMKGLRSLDLAIDAALALGQLDPAPEGLAELRLYAPKRTLDLSVLSEMPNLRKLYVKADTVTGLDSLSSLHKLERATFELTEETDFSVLSTLTQLRWLEISGSLGRSVLSDVKFVAPLVSLTNLDLSGNDIENIAPLENLSDLVTLKLTGNKNLTDISALSDLVNMSNLQLRQTQVSDLTALTNMNKLGILWLDRTPVADLSPLSELPNLWGLELSRTKVTDINALRNLPLKHLSLRGTGVTDFSAVPPGTKLKK